MKHGFQARVFPALTLALFAMALLLGTASAQDAEPYELAVWADVTYAPDGQITDLSFPQEKELPAAFLQNIRARIEARPPEPRSDGGEPATFQTGVRVTVTVTPATGSVSVDSIEEAPLVTRQTKVVFREEDAIMTEHAGKVQVRCFVSTKGRCQRVDFDAAGADVPAATRQHARSALAGWRFQPQKLNGKPIEGSVVVPFEIESRGVVRPTIKVL